MPIVLIFILLVGVTQSAVAQHQPIHTPSMLPGMKLRGLDPTKSITEYMHAVWQTEQGLPQNKAQVLCQTRDGYLWIGTDEGLVRFDGVRFVVFDKSTSPGLSNNIIQSLLEDRDGALWIGTGGGGVCRLRNGIFTSYTTKDGLANDIVWSLLQDRDGTLWVGTRGGGVSGLRFDKKGNPTVTPLTTNNELSKQVVLALLQDRSGTLWIGTSGNGVYGLHRDNSGKETWTNYKTDNGLVGNFVLSLVQDREGILWIGTTRGLTRMGLDNHGGRVFTNTTANNGLTGSFVRSLLLDRDGAVWIGLRDGGVNRFYNGTFEAYTTSEGLSNDDVRSLVQDRDGSLWIGTAVGGLNSLRDAPLTTIPIKNGLPDDVVQSVLQDSKGTSWISTGFVGIYSFTYDNRGKSIFRNYATKDGLSNNFVLPLLEDKSSDKSNENHYDNHYGALWIGTLGGGLNRLRYDSGGKGIFTSYTTKNGLSSNAIHSLLQDYDGALWIGTEVGVDRLKNGVFTSYPTQSGVSNNTVRALLQDRDSTFWIGTTNGLDHLRLDKAGMATFTRYTTKDGLSNNLIRSLMQDQSGVLWIGTQGGGINRFKNGKFISCTTKNGLFNDVVFCILEDDFGYLWMSCNKGIYRVRKSELNAFADGILPRISCEAFGIADGMKNAQCNSGSPAGWKDRDGRLWFATIAGVVMADPKKNHSNPLAPAVIIEEIKADTTILDINSAMTSAAGVEKLEFHYTATSLHFPERVKFKFMLEGYDKAWVDAETRRVAYYTSLQRGRNYRFRVIACNNSGVWNEVGASAMLYLTPNFWETWQFYTLCAVFMVSGMYGGVRWRLRRIHARAAELEKIVADRTLDLTNANIEIRRQLEIQAEQAREIEEANAELQDKNIVLKQVNKEKNDSIVELESFSYTVAHDLRTPLRAINSFSQIFIDDYNERLDSEGLRILGTITSNAAKMSVLIDGMLEVLRVGRQTPKLAVTNMMGIVQVVLAEMNRNEILKEYRINVEDLPEADCDPVLIKQVWANLLSNAVKYSRHAPEKHITIGSLLQNETTVYFVRDEGAGFDMRYANKLFQVFQRLHKEVEFEGLGVELTIVHRIIGKHGGKVWAEAEINKGATFYFTLQSMWTQ